MEREGDREQNFVDLEKEARRKKVKRPETYLQFY